MRTSMLVKSGVVALAAASAVAGLAAPASADIYPNAGDGVITGSDTTQFTSDFIFGGTTTGGLGYNVGKANRVFSFSATSDATARNTFDAAGLPLATTSVLRAGTNPVLRPNGSGAGARSLYQAPYIAPGPVVNAARMSALPSCANNASSVPVVGGLHVYQFATENFSIAVASPASGGTNAPAGLSIEQLVEIYKGNILTWGAIPGYAGPNPGATIYPQIPQPGSGTRLSFDRDLQAGNGGVPVPLNNPNSDVTQESDYTSIVGPTGTSLRGTPVDRIAFFSEARITLNDSGFNGPAAVDRVDARLGVPSAGVVYRSLRPLFFVVKQNDIASTVKFQPTGTRNFVNTFFASAGNVVQSPAFASNILAAGHQPAYADTGAPGVSGVSCI